MAYTTQIQTASPIFGRIAAFVAQAKARFVAYRAYRNTIDELSALSARELADLGVDRSNIKSIAFDATYK